MKAAIENKKYAHTLQYKANEIKWNLNRFRVCALCLTWPNESSGFTLTLKTLVEVLTQCIINRVMSRIRLRVIFYFHLLNQTETLVSLYSYVFFSPFSSYLVPSTLSSITNISAHRPSGCIYRSSTVYDFFFFVSEWSSLFLLPVSFARACETKIWARLQNRRFAIRQSVDTTTTRWTRKRPSCDSRR